MVVLALVVAFGSANAQSLNYSTLPNSPAYEAVAMPLRQQPDAEHRFNDAVLADVLRLLAESAGLSFYSLPEGSEEGEKIVTFSFVCSPFIALETLAKANGIALIYENGIWYLRPENDTHLIGRPYLIDYNPMEKVSSQGGSSGSLGSVGGGGGSGGGSGGGGGVSLPDTTNSFEVEPSKLLEDIRELLDIPTTSNVFLAGQTSVDQFSGAGGAGNFLLPSSIQGQPSESKDDTGSAAKVIWSSDANTLYVVATRQQHQWIEGYLAAADKPQSQIGIEVKFFETTKDPSSELGLDWTGTLGDGYSIGLTGDGTSSATSPSGTTTSGASEGIAGPINLHRIGDYALPMTAILSYEDVNVRLRALASDSDTKSVSYPRVVTTNNREVMIRSVINQPVLAASSSTSLGAGATTTQSVSYLPIGTVLNILPKQLGNGDIQLHVAITISSIIGETVIDGNPYPIASSRVYNAPVEVGSGYTVAIGGLDEAIWSQTESGIPLLRDVPGLKWAFQSKNNRRQRKRLMIMITPTVLKSNGGGLPDEPQAVIRTTPNDPAPPQIFDDGTLTKTSEGLDGALASLRHECDVLEAIFSDYSAEKVHKERTVALTAAVQATRFKIQSWAESDTKRRSELGAYDAKLAELEGRLHMLQKKAKWMRF
ncbi:MAG: hypothetical protein ACI8UO_003807 [Verrucomicrobiales bacterium]|jgi:hypothetical protein